MRRETAAVFRSINGRRYLSKSSAINADCRALMSRHWPPEGPTESGLPGMPIPGWHREESEEYKRIFARLLRFAKFVHRKCRAQPTNNETRG